MRKIEDIWDDNTHLFKSSTEIFNSLYDRRNWISEYSRMKKAIPQELKKMLKSEPVELNAKANTKYLTLHTMFVMLKRRTMNLKVSCNS
jgi:hypothetical protein